MVVFSLCCGEAGAVKLSERAELIEYPKVTGEFEYVKFENEYNKAVVACSYTLSSFNAPPALVRITDVEHGGMGIKLQQPESSADVEAGIVTCLIAEEGHHELPDGNHIQAERVKSETTHGQNAPDGDDIKTMNNVTKTFQDFKNPIVFGQVMSYNDEKASFFHANDCRDISNPPDNAGGICVTKHIGQSSEPRNTEMLGVIVFEGGDSKYPGIRYEVKLGAATVAGVGKSPPYTYGLSDKYLHALVIQSGMNGKQGSWAVSYGSKPVSGSTLSLAVDEEDTGGKNSRKHTPEQVAYFAINVAPVFTADLIVNHVAITEPTTLRYSIRITNTGSMVQSGVLVKPTLPDGTTGTVSAPSESMTADGYLEIGEIWKYEVYYPVTLEEIKKGASLVMSIKATSDQYTSEGLPNELASITTTITPAAPSLKVTKTADKTTEVAAGEVITYKYVVENTGNQTITKVALSDVHNGSGAVPTPKNENLTADNDINGDSSDNTSNDGVWDQLAPGDEVTFTATYTVTQTDLDTLQ